PGRRDPSRRPARLPLRDRTRMRLSLDSPVRDIDARVAQRRVGKTNKGPPAATVLEDSLGISTVRQLLHHYPRMHIDRTHTFPLRDLKPGRQATVIARVSKINKRLTRQKRTLVTLVLYDGTGYLDIPYFNQPWKATQFAVGEEVSAGGVVELRGGRRQLKAPEVESLKD